MDAADAGKLLSPYAHEIDAMNLLSQSIRAFCFGAALAAAVSSASSSRADHLRVYEEGKRPNDARLKPLKDLNGYFPFEVPADPAAWEKRAAELRRRVLVATGIWPLPQRTPLNPVSHGKVQRKGFTVEKVYFESIPNHFVTGLLFRPDDGKQGVKRPGVLSPHGHGGRLQDYGEKEIRKLIADGAERFEGSGRYPKLARCAHLARMGCVVFIFDMLGYADSRQISYSLAHRFAEQRSAFEGKQSWGLFSAQAELRLQSVMGIQTWNSIRCLDFLEQLPDVDGSRLAVTGGSGGGTQTILLCAIDERPIAAFPNGMVSTSMQGGCTCENCSLLRIGTGNVELAALFAPKPQAMTAADDWTREMMSKGYPQLQQLYEMLGAKKNVYCRPLLHFPHNYNYVTRATMYAWFNRHLRLGLEDPVLEDDFKPLTGYDVMVWNDDHPQPPGGEAYERSLTHYLATQADQQLAELTPRDAASLKRYRQIVGGAWNTLIGRGLPSGDGIQRTIVDKQQREGFLYFEDILRLSSHGEELPVISLYPTATEWNGDVVLWIDGDGKAGMFDPSGALHPQAQQLIEGGAAIVGADLFLQGEFLQGAEPIRQQRVVATQRQAAAYSFCYNHTLFAHRVHDVLTLISFVRHDEHEPKRLMMMARNGGGPIGAAARAIAGAAIDKAVLDTQGFRFVDITSYRDPQFLPGAVKYGDLDSLLALSAPHGLRIEGESGPLSPLVEATYAACGAPSAVMAADSQSPRQAIDWLLME